MTTNKQKDQSMSIPLISPEQLLPNGNSTTTNSLPLLIDVRTPMEFQEVHALGARNVPLDKLDPQRLRTELNGNQNDRVYFICRSGARGGKACQQMMDAGFKTVCNVDGGTMAWESSGLPVVRGKTVMSLERQVRITAGSIVAIGSLLAVFVHPNWGLLPAAVGSGLVFAGVSDSCAMGVMLSKMPWNQASSEKP
jgi:rhodanese-related sulfurtransferase